MARKKPNKVPRVSNNVFNELRDRIFNDAQVAVRNYEDQSLFRALDDVGPIGYIPNPQEPINEADEPEAAINEVEEIPPPLAQVEPEQIIINAQNGSQFYWSAPQNRWLIVGIPENEQFPLPAAPPRLRATAPAPVAVHFFAGDNNYGAQRNQNDYVADAYVAAAPAPAYNIRLEAPLPAFDFNAELRTTRPHARRDKLKDETKQMVGQRGLDPMYFEDLNNQEKIDVMKQEFIVLVKSIFDKPDTLKVYTSNKSLSRDQAKQIFKTLNKLNVNKCLCCRKFDQSLLSTPIDRELEPLIDIAQSTARSRSY